MVARVRTVAFQGVDGLAVDAGRQIADADAMVWARDNYDPVLP